MNKQKNTKLFVDLEFTGLHRLSTPISLGIISEDGASYYAEFTDYDQEQVTNFIRSQILSKLKIKEYDIYNDYDPQANDVFVKGNSELIRESLVEFLSRYPNGVEIWLDSPAFVWSMFLEILGGYRNLPKNLEILPYDLHTACKLYGYDSRSTDSRKEMIESYSELYEPNENNALNDAKINLALYKKLLLGLSEIQEDDFSDSEKEQKEEETESPKWHDEVLEMTKDQPESLTENLETPKEEEK